MDPDPPRTVARVLVSDRAALIAENLALRQQLAILQHEAGLVRLRRSDRIFWVWLSRLWSGWRSALVVVQPGTVVRWQREGFKLYWRWKSRRRPHGRPAVARDARRLIRRMTEANPNVGRAAQPRRASHARLRRVGAYGLPIPAMAPRRS